MSDEYRIEYTIKRAADESEEFVDVGFGSSGAWDDVDSALHALASDGSEPQLGDRTWDAQPG